MISPKLVYEGICLEFYCTPQPTDGDHGDTSIAIKVGAGGCIENLSIKDDEVVFKTTGDWEQTDLIDGLQKIINTIKEVRRKETMKNVNTLQDIMNLTGEDVIGWVNELSQKQKEDLRAHLEKTGKKDILTVKHYLGHLFYPDLYGDKKGPTFSDLLSDALK